MSVDISVILPYILAVFIVIAILIGCVVLMRQIMRTLSLRRQHAISEQLLQAELDKSLFEYHFKKASLENAWNGFRKFYVDRKVFETETICSFYLKPHDHQQLPPFLPGQYLIFNLHIPGQDKPVVRCYSLSQGAHSSNYYRVTIKHILPPQEDLPPGLSSSYFHKQVNEGDILDIKAPEGHFNLDPHEINPIVLLAGGIGVTPLLSMLNDLAAAHSKRDVWFFYGVLNGDDVIMRQHFERIAAKMPNLHLYFVYSKPNDDEVEGKDYDFSGHVSVALLEKLLPSNNFDFYICGPPPMMKAITDDLYEWGVPKDRVHFEAFGPASVAKVSESADKDEEPVEVIFTRSNKTVMWKPSEGSLLELAEKHGISIEFGCRAGSCGTCLVALKDGEVEYPYEPDSPIEAGSCLTCIGTPKGPIKLDA